MRSGYLADLTWPEVQAAASAGVALVIPVGSTEQHGPHLPLSTDTDVAVALCAGLVARVTDVLVAPAVAYGSSGEHAGFAGTLSIGQEATELLLLELGRSAFDTFQRVVFVSAHGGNAGPVSRAAARLRAEGRRVEVFAAHWDGDPHAGRTETSLQLALAPRRVLLANAAAGDVRPLPELLPELISGGVRAVSPNGVLGDPSGASAAEGDELLDVLVGRLATLVSACVAAR
ncbi:mycofactocin biosynthesis peptidyl-dipeptidase MftE [Jatrophihabitans sp.]|uniref:mycofactocin biosynthesis peptidyl-dipeptidase MftE n=1 Tax=Jatrophihabitans sp. TaxID=1932789 RepID=UPI0030C65D18|nr:putative creatininase [Jatrophihabitans sp.]